MQALNKRVRFAFHFEIHKHHRKPDALNDIHGLFTGRCEKHLPVTVEDSGGLVEDIRVVIYYKNHCGKSPLEKPDGDRSDCISRLQAPLGN